MFQSTYYIDKSSNTFADNLAAFGLAFVLNRVASGHAEVRLEDQGSVFSAVCEPPLEPEWVKQCEFFAGVPFLVTYDKKTETKKVKGTTLNAKDLERGDTVVDYSAEKQNNEAYFAWRKQLSVEERKKGVSGGPAAPHPHWDIFRAINPSALQGYNGLVAEWQRGDKVFPQLLQVLLQMTAQTPNDLEGAEKTWVKVCKDNSLGKPKDATALQLINPAQGKGVTNTKAEWRDPSNMKGFWLLEWLKVVGLFNGGITKIVANPRDPRNAKDRKTYVLNPVRLGWGTHIDVMHDFQSAMAVSTTAIKLDIYAALRYTMALLNHYESAREEDLEAELFGHSASDLVGGMQMAFYKNLGNSAATMNIACINLPRWVKPQSRSDLAQLQTALDEHLAIVRGLDETRGDQYTLLGYYRDFLSANDLARFFEFTNAYSGFIMSQRERRKYVRQFTTTTLEVLFMNSDDSRKTYSRILESDGFRNIASAIRRSTVVPQGRKAKGVKPAVNIRYGLGQQLARKSVYTEEFLAELAEFIHLYNSENAQLRENKRNPFRKNVTTTDIEQVTALVDEFGSKVVCNMLVAYGYASEPYSGERPKDEQTESSDEMDLENEAEDEGEGEE